MSRFVVPTNTLFSFHSLKYVSIRNKYKCVKYSENKNGKLWDLKRIFEGVLSLIPAASHLQQVLGVEHGEVSAWKFS